MRFANSRTSAERMLRIAMLAAAAMLATTAGAATFYKWTDKDGNVHYSDAAPKGVTGVTRVEIDEDAHTVPAPVPAQAAREGAAKPVPDAAPGVPDILTQRRETRARLEANLHAARERLDLARKALSEFTATGGDQQYIQTQVDPSAINRNQANEGAEIPAPSPSANPDVTQSQPTRGGMLGMAPRANCRTAVGKDGKKVLICPTAVANQDYFRKEQELEDAVKRAEADVAEAEVAYRKGVD